MEHFQGQIQAHRRHKNHGTFQRHRALASQRLWHHLCGETYTRFESPQILLGLGQCKMPSDTQWHSIFPVVEGETLRRLEFCDGEALEPGVF